MRVIEGRKSQRIGCLPDVEILMLGGFAVAVLHIFRVFSVRYPAVMWAECLLLLAVPVGLLFWLAPRLANDQDDPGKDRTILWLQLGAAGIGLLVVAVQFAFRQIGIGDAYEIATLLVLSHVGWYFVVFSKFGSFERVALVINAALVLFVCFMSDRVDVYIVSLLFAVTALWRLLGTYWNRINSKSLDGESKMLPVSGIAVGVTILLASLAGGTVWMVAPGGGLYSGSGFSFFAGGEQGFEDEFANSGIGDGNMLTGGANATTSGAVDTDNFIEDDKPSIYDTMSEKFEGPLTPRERTNVAVALDARAKHMHEVVQSEQAGKSFRTSRKSGKESELSLEDRRTNALFFVEGSVPARFRIDSFNHFDGWDWTKTKIDPKQMKLPMIHLTTRWSKLFYVLRRTSRNYLTSRRAHRVKIMRLDTNVLPVTPFLEAWHIHRLKDKNLFQWNDQGMVRIVGDFIPTHTMIDVVSEVPNYHLLRDSDTRSSLKAGLESSFLQVPDNDTGNRVRSIVEELTRGVDPGWNQVEAIVNHFRENYVHDVSMVADPDGPDSVAAFLDQGGGPSYLFATAATQFIRAAGYRTRMTSGFVIGKDDFDHEARQSIVTFDNAHFWPEVSLDGTHWIPVEPDPAFEVPFRTQTWWQWTKGQVGRAVMLMKQNPLVTSAAILLLGGLCWFRKEIFVGILRWCWLVAIGLMPAKRLKFTRKLIDARFRTAGLGRPSFESIRTWFSQVDPEAGADFFTLWWQDNFGSGLGSEDPREKVLVACQQIESQLSFSRIKSFVQKTGVRNP